MKTFNDIYDIIGGKTATTIPHVARSSRGKYSLGIVCSAKNGKRLTITASLANALKLSDKVFVTVYAEDRIIILSPTAINKYSVEAKLKDDKGKVAYNASLVHFLIDTFKLDYKNTVSRVFHDFSFNDDPNTPMAILTFPKVRDADDIGDAQEANHETRPET